jgi:DNA-binding Lrp family transcriptional regulator
MGSAKTASQDAHWVPDAFDFAILDILQTDSSVPLRLVAEAVHLSAAAVHRRVRRMQEEGVIEATVVLVDPARVGRPITVIVEVHVESERLDLLDAIKASFADDPEVQQCYYVTGEADFVLIVTVDSMGGYEALTRRLFFGNPNVKRFGSLIVMDRIKARLAVPVTGRTARNEKPRPDGRGRSLIRKRRS